LIGIGEALELDARVALRFAYVVQQEIRVHCSQHCATREERQALQTGGVRLAIVINVHYVLCPDCDLLRDCATLSVRLQTKAIEEDRDAAAL